MEFEKLQEFRVEEPGARIQEPGANVSACGRSIINWRAAL